MKANSCVQGPNDNIMLPKNSVKTDWEVELGVVIGTRASYVSQAQALNYVAGFAPSTMCPSANTNSSVASPGTRARVATPLAP